MLQLWMQCRFWACSKGKSNCCKHVRGAAGLCRVDEAQDGNHESRPEHAEWEVLLPELWFYCVHLKGHRTNSN